MGTARTLKNRISMVRQTFKKVSDLGLKINRKKLEAEICLNGLTARYARELVQTFIDAGEVFEDIIDGEKVLTPNPNIYQQEKQQIKIEVEKELEDVFTE